MNRSPVAAVRVVVLVFWLALPFVYADVYAEDAAPFVAAGRLVGDRPDSVYVRTEGADWRLTPEFERALCTTTDDTDGCRRFALPFVSPPIALGPARAVAALGDRPAVFAYRLLAAGGFVAGMTVLWRRGAPGSELRHLAVAALLTPFVMNVVAFGQNSSLLFLLPCLAVGARGRDTRGVALAVTWVATIAAKAFPLLLAPVLVWQRQWRALAVAGGATVAALAATAAAGGAGLTGPFLDATAAIARTGVSADADVSLDALIRTVIPGYRTVSPAGIAFWLARAAAVTVLFITRVRHHGPERQWAFSCAALLVLVPQVWWHYEALAVAALAVVLLERRDRHAWWPVAAAGLAAVLGLPTSPGLQLATATAAALGSVAVLALVPTGAGAGARAGVAA